MRYQIQTKRSDAEGSHTDVLTIVDNDGKVVAEGHLVADYEGGTPESLIVCGVRFEGIHKASA